MEHFPELRSIVDSFDNSEELEEFAEFTGFLDDHYVKQKLLELKWDEIELELDLPPLPKRQRIDQYGGHQPSRPYQLKKVSEKQFKTKTAVDIKYQVHLDKDFWNDKKLKDIHGDLHDMFKQVLDEAKDGSADNDVGRVLIHHPSLDNAIVIPLHPLEELDADLVMEHVEKVLQSHEELAVTEGFNIDIGIINVPKGSGRKRITDISGGDDSIKKKTSIVQIVNEDSMCMARSIAVCWARANKISYDEWKELTRNEPQAPIIQQIVNHGKVPDRHYRQIIHRNKREQEYLAVAISDMADVPTDRPATLNDLSAFEEVLGVNILVVSARLGNNFIKITDNADRKNLYLYLVENGEIQHFHAIVNISGFFSRSYFCETCLKPYSHRENHSCTTTCIVCKTSKCTETDVQMSCIKCHMTCRSLECFQRHVDKPKFVTGPNKEKPRQKSECEKWWKCTVCYKVLDRTLHDPKHHKCGEYLCKSCQRYVLEHHLCYLRANPVNDMHIPKFVFFEFECTQDTLLQCDEGYLPGTSCRNCNDGTCKDCTRCQHCSFSWCGKSEHRANFVVAQTVCYKCMDEPVNQKCKTCGTRCKKCEGSKTPCKGTCGLREVVFQGNDTSLQFGKWLFSTQHQYFTAIAHNMKGYDGYFLLEYLIDQSIRPDKIIYNGSKIMCMHVGKGLDIKVVDSLNFLPMKLAALPKSFGLKELKKGWFPHLFNLQQNQTYRGPYPAPHFYGCDRMNTGDRKSFMEWYDTTGGELFDFREAMLSYCRSDVDILRRACLKFRDLLMNAAGHWEEVTNDNGKKEQKLIAAIDPFDYTTIASVCMGVYKTKFMEETWRVKLKDGDVISEWMEGKILDGKLAVCVAGEWKDDLGEKIVCKEFVKSPIALVPSDGYGQKQQYSKVSIQWLEWMKHNTNANIQHALNGGEKKLPGSRYKLDGYCAETNTAYEFHGCVYHGCPKCFKQDRDTIKHPRTNQSMAELFALTMKKKNFIEQMGMKYVCIWEHEFKHLRIKNETCKHFVDSLDIVERLNPRDSFFGGRTNACKLRYKVKDGEQIKYVDFTSLYPWVNKYCRYPVGHPDIITSNFGDIRDYFGIAKVNVLPPRGLYLPVLPYRSNGKLKFPLCRTCADNENQTPCVCTDDERSVVGTWCTPEIQLAIDRGYKIIKIYEIYHWKDTSQYDPSTREGGLFATYINTFLKFKQEASGWPDWIKTEQDRKKYVEQYFVNEGVTLDGRTIDKNPGLRALAKLCLNSFWGKFEQRLNMKQSEFIHETEAERFFQILSDSQKDIQNFHIAANDMIQLEWIHKSAFVPEDFKTNIFLAVFTTTYARIKLLTLMNSIHDDNAGSILYHDTDSVIYVNRPGKYDPPLGDYLGELTNELDGDDYIVEFVSGGPKNYSYRTKSGKECCKVRGFTLNFTNSKLVNFEVMKDIITTPDKIDSVTLVNPSKICREKRKRKLFNREERKKYQKVYTKRVLLPDMDTVPYGF